jgi:hypothetical protein
LLIEFLSSIALDGLASLMPFVRHLEVSYVNFLKIDMLSSSQRLGPGRTGQVDS